jgi:hypothetical protein
MILDAGDGLSSETQEYNPTPIINEMRGFVEAWRNLPNTDQWLVSPETARLLQHWRHYPWRCSTWVWDGRDKPTLNYASARFSDGNMM